MRSRVKSVVSAVVTVVALAAVVPSAGAASPLPPPKDAKAVVALIDTGINPYHRTFRDYSPRAQDHPSTYIPGFPKSAKPLRLSLHEDDYMTAVMKDCERVWKKIKPGKLYWVPGTKIVGAISFENHGSFHRPMNCSNPLRHTEPILDTDGHGTMVASRAASNEYGACESCHIVAIQGLADTSIEWAAKNSSWIDVQSNSWGPFLPVWTPTRSPGNHPEFVRSIEASGRKHLSFWAAGNGALTRFGVLGHPTTIDPRMTPSIVRVGGHDSGYMNTWPGFPPHVISDSCNSWAAYHDKVNDSADDVGGGTSGASPYAAGGAAAILMEARDILGDRQTGVSGGVAARGRAGIVSKGPLADGKFTLKEWKEVVFKTASERPKRHHDDGSICLVDGLGIYSSTPIRWQDVPDSYPEYFQIGYGAVDKPSIKRAFDVLRGGKPLPNRAETDAFFERERQLKDRSHDIYDGGR